MQALEVEVEVEVTVEVEVEVELVLAQPPLEQGRQWPAELVHELALKEPPAELVLEFVLAQPHLVWVEGKEAHVLLSHQWPA